MMWRGRRPEIEDDVAEFRRRSIAEESAGSQRSSSKIFAARRCSASSSGPGWGAGPCLASSSAAFPATTYATRPRKKLEPARAAQPHHQRVTRASPRWFRRSPRSPGPRPGAGAAQGKLVTLTGTVPEGVVAPVLLITWVMTPLKLSDTVKRSWNSTPVAVGTSKAWEALTAGLVLKKQ